MTLWLNDRAVVAISGPEARDFLQGLITNDIRKVGPEVLLYGALLTPQGKIFYDFLIGEQNGDLLLDCAAADRDSLAKKLTLYRLRTKVTITPRDDLSVFWHPPGDAAVGFLPDPRHSGLGFRAFLPKTRHDAEMGAEAFRETRLKLGVPEGRDFGRDAIFALDADLDELHAVAFDKGCYVGQELTARMKHRGTARKRLLAVAACDGATLPAPPAVIVADGREIGALQTVYGARGFALVRLDRLEGVGGAALETSGIAVILARPDWLFA